MGDDLDAAMWAAWQRIKSKVIGNEIELQRRLDRRAKTGDRVPRPLCLALKASDRRITAMTARRSLRDAMDKGNETEHDVHLDGRTIRDLCRPVELYWGQKFRTLARELGVPRQIPRRLEQRGILRSRRIAMLGGHRGLPVPLVDSPVPATATPDLQEWEHYGHPKLLDPGARGHCPPDKLLLPYWQHLSLRMPAWFEQTIRRKPIFRVQRGRLRFMHWAWVCPGCKREVNTIHYPIGAPDFLAMHNIKLPHDHQQAESVNDGLPCFACQHCHHLFGIARTPKSIAKSWSLLIAHMSGGLLFGHEVKRPASFSAIRKNNDTELAAPRSSPRRDELEAYLAHTDLSLKEIARRMRWTYASTNHELHLICKKHRLKGGRAALKRWWARHHPTEVQMAA